MSKSSAAEAANEEVEEVISDEEQSLLDEKETDEELGLESDDEELDDEEAEDEESEESGESEKSEEADETDEETDEEELELPTRETLLTEERDRMARERDHYKSAHDNMGGKVSAKLQSLRDEIADLKQRRQEGDRDDGYAEERRERRPEQSERGRSDDGGVTDRVERLEVQEAARVGQVAAKEFFDKRPALTKLKGEELKLFDAAVASKLPDLKEAVVSGDAGLVKLLTEGLLSGATMAVVDARQKNSKDRREKQDERLRKRKKHATHSGAGKERSAPKPPKDPEDQSIEEMEAEFRKIGRKGF